MASQYNTGGRYDMSEFWTQFFSTTTAEDQRDYFFGDVQLNAPVLSDNYGPLAPGDYFIVRGNLRRRVSEQPLSTKTAPDH